jgi:hypothetical protein
MGAVGPGGRRGLAAPAAGQSRTIQDVQLEVGHAYMPTDNGNDTISQRCVTLYVRIESNRLHIDFRSILW